MSVGDVLGKIKAMPSTTLITIAVIAILVFTLPFYVSRYVLFAVCMALIYAMVTASYDVLLGYTGQLSFCQGAFVGIAAYTSAILTVKLGWSSWAALPVALILTAIISAAVGYPALRLRGAYFAVTTFFLAHFVYLILLNSVKLTYGPLGFKGIRPPDPIGPIHFTTMTAKYYLILVSFIIVLALLYKLVHSNLGYIFVSIREDETLAESIGINTAMYKLLSFVISAVVAGFAGVLYTHFFQLLHPTTFSWMLSEMTVIMTIVGGAGTLIGPVIGAGVVTFALELLRSAPYLRYIIWAVALVAILLFEPRGLMGLVERLRRR